MRISGTEPSSVILSQSAIDTAKFQQRDFYNYCIECFKRVEKLEMHK